jgi:hypothetical protein
LILVGIFVSIATCPLTRITPRKIELQQASEKAQSRLRQRIGAWCWKHKVNRPPRRRHWKNFAAPIGEHWQAGLPLCHGTLLLAGSTTSLEVIARGLLAYKKQGEAARVATLPQRGDFLFCRECENNSRSFKSGKLRGWQWKICKRQGQMQSNAAAIK